jgi:hypothetical protein
LQIGTFFQLAQTLAAYKLFILNACMHDTTWHKSTASSSFLLSSQCMVVV